MRLLTHIDLALASCQASAYTPGHQFAVARFMRELLPAWAGRFDAEPVIVPAAEGVRVALLSRSTMWRCEISGPRIDLYWVRPEAAAPEIAMADFFAAAGPFLAEFCGFAGARVGRLAAITRRVGQHESPSLFLARHFGRVELQDSLLDAAQSFELHVHKRVPLGGRFIANTRLRSAAGIAVGIAVPTLLEVEQDFNTLADEAASRSFKPAEMAEFFTQAAIEMQRGLEQAYPRPR